MKLRLAYFGRVAPEVYGVDYEAIQGRLGPGTYVVSWTSVSALDGHVLSGGFHFGVGVSAHPPGSMAHGQAGGIYTQDFGVIVAG